MPYHARDSSQRQFPRSSRNRGLGRWASVVIVMDAARYGSAAVTLVMEDVWPHLNCSSFLSCERQQKRYSSELPVLAEERLQLIRQAFPGFPFRQTWNQVHQGWRRSELQQNETSASQERLCLDVEVLAMLLGDYGSHYETLVKTDVQE